ncbi:hypothetical protein [Roseisolibacter agri]|uniref:Uncharacterized protein n=1 Tax=Roseisolibacter agri TaxID=2014610 RepID=A0AA37QBV5_9BACT|nr:hypothetical protein [Roseisolibacter agri]GLC26866.1 hypothetical protein rosag_33790 [Roseisolibacter agri]
MHVNLRRAWATLVTATSLAVAGCASDLAAPTGPAAATTAAAPAIGTFRPSVQVAQDRQQRVFTGPRGRRFTIDHATARITDDSGRAAQLNDRQLRMVERSLDDIAAFEARLARLQRDPGFRGRMERASRNPRKVLVRTHAATAPAAAGGAKRAGSALAPAASPVRAASALRPGSPTLALASDACTDLELAIYATTEAYQSAVDAFEQNLLELVTLGWDWNNGEWVWSPESYLSQLASWEMKQTVLAATISMLRVQLDIMAVQYDMMGCWDQPPQEPGTGTPGTGGGGGGGGTTPTCHEEYVIVEVSDDGGMTWYIYWEGWAEVCE